MVDKVSAVARKSMPVDEIVVVVSDGSNLFGNGEDDMKIVRVENFGRSFFNPLCTCE